MTPWYLYYLTFAITNKHSLLFILQGVPTIHCRPLNPLLSQRIQLNLSARLYKFGLRQSNSYTGLDIQLGLQESEAPRFKDSRQVKVEKLPALSTGRLYLPRNIPGTHFYFQLVALEFFNDIKSFRPWGRLSL